MRRIGILSAIALVAILIPTGCGRQGAPGDPDASGYKPTVAQNVEVAGSPAFAQMKQRGRVVIGVRDDQPGLAFRDATTGQYSGFDIDMARMIAGGLGFAPDKIDYKVVPSATREDAIARGEVDYFVSSYTINDKRKQRVSFAGPYFVAGQTLLVRAGDNSITGPQTLKGKRVCSVTGSTPIQRVRDEGLTEPNNIIEFQNQSQCVDALRNGRVDAVTTDDAILKGYAAQAPDQLKVVGKLFSTEPYGVGLARDDAALRNEINNLLQAAMDDGTWQQIYDGTLGKSGSPASPPKIQRY